MVHLLLVCVHLVLFLLHRPEPTEPARVLQSLVVAVLVEHNDTLVVVDTGVRVGFKDELETVFAYCRDAEVSHGSSNLRMYLLFRSSYSLSLPVLAYIW